MPQPRSPHRDYGQSAVVLFAHHLCGAVRWDVAVRGLVRLLASFVHRELGAAVVWLPVGRVAVLLVQDGCHGLLLRKLPPSYASPQLARVLVPERHELGHLEDVHPVQIPEAVALAVDARVIRRFLHVVVEVPSKGKLGLVLALLVGLQERHAVPERVHDPLGVEAVEEVAGNLVVAGGEILKLGSAQVEDGLHVLVDCGVSLLVVQIRFHCGLVDLTRPVHLYGVPDEPVSLLLWNLLEVLERVALNHFAASV